MRTLFSGLLSIAFAIALAGCFEDINKVYDGPLQVEFAQYHQPGALATSNIQYHSTFTFPHNAPETATASVALKLQMIGPHQSNDTFIALGVAETRPTAATGRPATTTAVEGKHFSIVNAENRAVFPANSSFSTANLEISPADVAPGTAVHVQLELVDGDPLIPATNYRFYTVTIARAATPPAP
jgi:hypothetical protein